MGGRNSLAFQRYFYRREQHSRRMSLGPRRVELQQDFLPQWNGAVDLLLQYLACESPNGNDYSCGWPTAFGCLGEFVCCCTEFITDHGLRGSDCTISGRKFSRKSCNCYFLDMFGGSNRFYIYLQILTRIFILNWYKPVLCSVSHFSLRMTCRELFQVRFRA